MPRDGNYLEHLTEVNENYGIELELTKVNRENRNFINEFNNLFNGWKRVHDGSCETPILSLAGIPIEFNNQEDKDILMPLLKDYQILLGGEIVSPILSTKDDLDLMIHKLCDLLWKYGESSLSGDTRDSLHIHINVGKTIPLFKIINLLKLHSAYEAILYRLGGMGTTNRGDFNEYIFMRPFLGNSAPVVRYDNRKYPIFVYEDLINSKTKEEFFDRYGDTNSYSPNKTRYVTQRYVGLNFYSIPMYGTIEFRHANKVIIPEWIISWLNLCISFVKICDNPNLQINIERPLYENREISDEEFLDSLNIFKLNSEDIVNLLDIWQKSKTPNYDNKWRYSHLPNPTFFRNNYIPSYIEDKVYKPSNIHVRDVEDQLRNDIRLAMEKIPRDFNDQLQAVRYRINNDIRNWVLIGKMKDRYSIRKLEKMIEENIIHSRWIYPEKTMITGVVYKQLTLTFVCEDLPEMIIFIKHENYGDIFRFECMLEELENQIGYYFPDNIIETIKRANNEGDFFFEELIRHEEYNGNELRRNEIYNRLLRDEARRLINFDLEIDGELDEEEEEDIL